MSLNMIRARQKMGGSMLARYAQDSEGFEAPFRWQVNPLAEVARAGLADPTGVTDWRMRRLDKRSLPASSMSGLGAYRSYKGEWKYTGLDASNAYRYTGLDRRLGETTDVTDWKYRRLDKGTIPASDLSGLGAYRNYKGEWKYTGLDAGSVLGPSRVGLNRWGVNPLGDPTGVTDWRMRRLDKRRLPASSLSGSGSFDYKYSGLGYPGSKWRINPMNGLGYPGSKWKINPLGDPTGVTDWRMRRLDKRSLPASSLMSLREQESNLIGFGSFGALDATVSVREVQTVLRKLNKCVVIDGAFGDQTSNALLALTLAFGSAAATTGGSAGSKAGMKGLYAFGAAEDFFAGQNGARTIQIESSFWARLNEAAAGRTDTCPTSSGGGGSASNADQGDDSGDDDLPMDEGGGGGGTEAAAWYQNPWYLGGAAALAVGAVYLATRNR
jgi:hypothetical protein